MFESIMTTWFFGRLSGRLDPGLWIEQGAQMFRCIWISVILLGGILYSGCATGAGGLPYAKPVKGKPGIVLSPYSADVAEIDVSGHARGEQIRDPFTGQYFLVP